MLESGIADTFDEVILVTAPRRLRLERLQKRGVSLPRAKAVMRVQLPVFMLRRVATRTILNTGSLDELRASARDLLRLLCE